ncbi:MAG: dihydroneopterin aldolase [Bacillales bacterium]|jgi:protein-disulfide isomerase|nr:dihydroneopterin aldolase [Bacillales bacterium]
MKKLLIYLTVTTSLLTGCQSFKEEKVKKKYIFEEIKEQTNYTDKIKKMNEDKDIIIKEYSPDITLNKSDIENQPMIGTKNAPISILVFGDYYDSNTHKWYQEVYPKIVHKYVYSKEVKIYFINLQKSSNSAKLAGVASELMYKEGRLSFIDYHNRIINLVAQSYKEDNPIITNEKYLENIILNQIQGIDQKRVIAGLKSQSTIDELRKDELISEKHRINNTPSIIVNNETIFAKDGNYPSFKEVEDAINKCK